ncbi:MAG: efflux RND transporter periplasmic adaptor subunit [Mariprofundus sp.]|nr:efflux RND transporter periplasmic adaptor subunit [Mariprofundus sp.]
MAKNSKMIKRMIWMVLGVGLLFAALFGYHLFGNYMMQKYLSANARPSATVTAMQVRYQDWQPQRKAVGSLRAVQGVNISAEVSGQVSRVHVHSGQIVKKGEVLLELNHADDIASLHALQADAKLAEISFRRDKAQLAARAISHAVFDVSSATLKRTRAAVARQQALIAKKRIVAPFAGHIGIVTINPGQYLNPADEITTLQNIDALFVDFFLPQKDLGGLAVGQSLSVRSDAWPGEVFSGRISAINSVVDTATRNVRIEGRIDQPQGKLAPGMFVKLSVMNGQSKRYLSLPQTAISYNAYGATVFLARKSKQSTAAKPVLEAQQEFVKTGPVRGDQVAVVSGVHKGDLVVTSGLMKLKNGTPLIIDNTVQPANDAAPTPQEQ